MLPSKSVADPLPWELGLVGAAQSRLLAQHHVGLPRKRHHSWRLVESREFSAQGFQKAPSQQAAKGTRAAAGRGLGVLPAEVPPTRSGQSQLNLRGKGARRLPDFTIGETEAREGADDLLTVSKLWVLSWATLPTPPPVCEISFRAYLFQNSGKVPSNRRTEMVPKPVAIFLQHVRVVGDRTLLNISASLA